MLEGVAAISVDDAVDGDISAVDGDISAVDDDISAVDDDISAVDGDISAADVDALKLPAGSDDVIIIVSEAVVTTEVF